MIRNYLAWSLHSRMRIPAYSAVFLLVVTSATAYAADEFIPRDQVVQYVEHRVALRYYSLLGMKLGPTAYDAPENISDDLRASMIPFVTSLAQSMGTIIGAYRDARFSTASLNADIDAFVYTMSPVSPDDVKGTLHDLKDITNAIVASIPHRPSEASRASRIALFDDELDTAVAEYESMIRTAKLIVVTTSIPPAINDQQSAIVLHVDRKAITKNFKEYISRFDITGYAANQELDTAFFVKKYIDESVYCEHVICRDEIRYFISNRFLGATGWEISEKAKPLSKSDIIIIVHNVLLPKGGNEIRMDDPEIAVKAHFAAITDRLFGGNR